VPTPGISADAFTIWLRASLRRVHDAVAAEPVPEALRRLAAGEDAEPPSVNSAPGTGMLEERSGAADVKSSASPGTSRTG
jgi:hypothetical protein